jgi:hypothetical protein
MQIPPRQSFQPRRNIDAIAESVVVIKNDVTDMDADAKFVPLILRHAVASTAHSALDLPRLANSANMPSPVVLTMRLDKWPASQCPLWAVASTGRRNTLSWSEKMECDDGSGAFVER